MSDKRARQEIVDFIVEQFRNFDADLFDAAAIVLIKDGKPVGDAFYNSSSKHGQDLQKRHIIEGLQQLTTQAGKNWGVL